MTSQILTVPCLSDNYAYLIGDNVTRKSILIDAPEAEPIEEILNKNNWQLDTILITHHHQDHVQGVETLRKKYQPKTLGALEDKERLPKLDFHVSDNETFCLGHMEFKALEVSGHTIGHMAFYCKKLSAVFTGDSLMALGCGRLFEGTAFQMLRSLKKISSLPNETMVYSGHEYALNNGKFALSLEPNNQSLADRVEKIKKNLKANRPNVPVSLQEEKKTNPFLRYNVPTLKQMLMMDNNSEEEIFAALRNMKDNF